VAEISEEAVFTLVNEAAAARTWREVEFGPWKRRVDKRLDELDAFDARVIADAAGNEANLMAELLNVKNEVVSLKGEIDGARSLAGKLPALESQIASTQISLADGAKELTKAAATIQEARDAAENAVKEDRLTRARWRKLQTPAIAVATAILMALTQRFVLPPAASNSDHTLLPGPTPTVNITPPNAAGQLR
jgi:hypothetical protein